MIRKERKLELQEPYYLGMDFGTSGARGIVIDEALTVVQEVKYGFPTTLDLTNPRQWQTGLESILNQISLPFKQRLQRIAIDGTSATVLGCDRKGNPVTPVLLYSDSRGEAMVKKVQALLPQQPVVLSATSSLTKLLWYEQNGFLKETEAFLHQADWLGFLLHGQLGISDYHNALKLGYDVERLTYPQPLQQASFFSLLPQVYAPGKVVAQILPTIAETFQINPHCGICTGTTDSIGAFLASGVNTAGEAVTSLGSTLVLKLLSAVKIDQAESGIYSHRFGNLWLTGGASNAGGAVLKHFFSEAELNQLSLEINPHQDLNLKYYPLLKRGDRFPINDPQLLPQLSPRPKEPVQFLQGLLEGLARLETMGYQRLQELGATPLTQVYTAGGGAKNETWRQIRQRYLSVPVLRSQQVESAYGTALLAKNQGVNN